ncbi:MAG TPA: hypothetical protein VL131_09120 [Gammaproteobacteria bacterium]|nr:hypothetical protein [Gammaproteobacteria bacterium]
MAGTAARSSYADAGDWKGARTPDGQPDLRGEWTNDSYTPLERPEALGDKEFYTADEAAKFVQSRLDRLHSQPASAVHYDDAIWQAENYAKVASLRTSIIFEPRNGRLPPLTAAAKERLPLQRVAQRGREPSSRATDRSLGERCISWGNVGPPMLPPTYNANLQIMQAQGVVVIRHEMMHDTRVVYLDGRKHPPASVQWMAGHSVGRWEGQTLVVDTTNFTDDTNFRGSPANTRQDIFGTARMHVVERFTRKSDDTIDYQFTVEDPDTWTAPWSGAEEIRRVASPIYEFACHEGNYGLANILSAQRAGARPATQQPD